MKKQQREYTLFDYAIDASLATFCVLAGVAIAIDSGNRLDKQREINATKNGKRQDFTQGSVRQTEDGTLVIAFPMD